MKDRKGSDVMTHQMRSMKGPRAPRRGCGVLAAVAALVPALSAAQASPSPEPGAWQFGASLYGYLPSLSGKSSAPADSGGTPIEIDADKLVDNLKFTFMGALEAHNGRWGLFTDVLYLNLGGDKHQTRDFTIGGAIPPVGTTADLDWNFKGNIWTLGGEYRVLSQPGTTIDVLAGARRFDVKTESRWSITGDLGVLLPEGRTGSTKNTVKVVDGIVGVKGRVGLEPSGRWSLPFYLDVGTGESHLTWQAIAGVSYAFKWGELTARWRYLAYEMKSGRNLEDLKFSGPLIGATWRW